MTWENVSFQECLLLSSLCNILPALSRDSWRTDALTVSSRKMHQLSSVHFKLNHKQFFHRLYNNVAALTENIYLLCIKCCAKVLSHPSHFLVSLIVNPIIMTYQAFKHKKGLHNSSTNKVIPQKILPITPDTPVRRVHFTLCLFKTWNGHTCTSCITSRGTQYV